MLGTAGSCVEQTVGMPTATSPSEGGWWAGWAPLEVPLSLGSFTEMQCMHCRLGSSEDKLRVWWRGRPGRHAGWGCSHLWTETGYE